MNEKQFGQQEQATRRAVKRAQWTCDYCGGFFTDSLPVVLDDGSHLCENCLEVYISEGEPDARSDG